MNFRSFPERSWDCFSVKRQPGACRFPFQPPVFCCGFYGIWRGYQATINRNLRSSHPVWWEWTEWPSEQFRIWKRSRYYEIAENGPKDLGNWMLSKPIESYRSVQLCTYVVGCFTRLEMIWNDMKRYESEMIHEYVPTNSRLKFSWIPNQPDLKPTWRVFPIGNLLKDGTMKESRSLLSHCVFFVPKHHWISILWQCNTPRCSM